MESYFQKWWRVEGRKVAKGLLALVKAIPLLLVVGSAFKASEAAIHGPRWVLVLSLAVMAAGLFGVFYLTRTMADSLRRTQSHT